MSKIDSLEQFKRVKESNLGFIVFSDGISKTIHQSNCGIIQIMMVMDFIGLLPYQLPKNISVLFYAILANQVTRYFCGSYSFSTSVLSIQIFYDLYSHKLRTFFHPYNHNPLRNALMCPIRFFSSSAFNMASLMPFSRMGSSEYNRDTVSISLKKS
ncbi:MAG: hypothetical protein HW420_1262 [Candidatus Nitrosotenuis sp.]|nr:hypothetical protein [Candidatus Nitrosotenuis sp.]